MNVRRVGAVVAASVRMFRRDRPATFFTFAFPIMFIVLFGLIFGGSGTSRPTVNVVGSGPLRQALERSDAVKVKVQPDEARGAPARFDYEYQRTFSPQPKLEPVARCDRLRMAGTIKLGTDLNFVDGTDRHSSLSILSASGMTANPRIVRKRE